MIPLRLCVTVLTFLIVGFAATFAIASAEEGFRPLFNGKDLTGWVLVNTPPQTWSVEDRMLICTGKPVGEIRTERMYQNFVMEVEWRHMVPKGNAGIFVWADDITSKGVPFHRGIEVQVLENAYGQSQHHTTHGDIFPIHGASMTPVNGRGGGRAFPTEERSKPSPEWNHYRIECNDGKISLAVNGRVVTQGIEAKPSKGYICIESEGGVVHYRNMKIKELPETPIDDSHIAVEDRGYRSLYTGLDLSGWKATSASAKEHWHVQDWILAFDGGISPIDGLLSSNEALDNAGFLFDIRPGDHFDGFSIGNLVLANKLKQGEWHRLEGTVQDGKLTLSINGKPVVADHALDAAVFHLGPNGPADFANIYIRKLAE
ncbi:MAG: DUF1080 domain-containing protein [Planctomycetota bacterium]|nr:DUF1080 domain-containing protein [Planctomycetota bacterium]